MAKLDATGRKGRRGQGEKGKERKGIKAKRREAILMAGFHDLWEMKKKRIYNKTCNGYN